MLRSAAGQGPVSIFYMLYDVLQNDCLGPGHFIECGHDTLSAYAGIFISAERHLETSEEAGAIDDGAAALESVTDLYSCLHVTCEDTSAETEL